jgi:hypothetical protein
MLKGIFGGMVYVSLYIGEATLNPARFVYGCQNVSRETYGRVTGNSPHKGGLE